MHAYLCLEAFPSDNGRKRSEPLLSQIHAALQLGGNAAAPLSFTRPFNMRKRIDRARICACDS